jgi:hypothetical protein
LNSWAWFSSLRCHQRICYLKQDVNYFLVSLKIVNLTVNSSLSILFHEHRGSALDMMRMCFWTGSTQIKRPDTVYQVFKTAESPWTIFSPSHKVNAGLNILISKGLVSDLILGNLKCFQRLQDEIVYLKNF